MLLGARALVWVAYAYVVVTEVVLTLGFVLLLTGANPDASFVAWAYRSLDRAMEPFRGMFTPIDLDVSANDDVGAVLDTSVLFAMLVYAFVGWAVHALLGWLTDLIRRSEVDERRGAPAPGTWPANGAANGAASGPAAPPPYPPQAPRSASPPTAPPASWPGPTTPPPSSPPR